VALEERGFDSLWVAEHSHIPVSRRFSHPQGEAALVEVSDQLAPVANRSRPTTATRAHPRAPGRRRSSRGENSPCGGPSEIATCIHDEVEELQLGEVPYRIMSIETGLMGAVPSDLRRYDIPSPFDWLKSYIGVLREFEWRDVQRLLDRMWVPV
jgi:hypothetical protein